jgi:hypothetical protein
MAGTLDHWRDLLDEAFKLMESLRAELFKSRAETQDALGEKEKAESECIHAKLKLDQMQAHLDNAQEVLHARAQDRTQCVGPIIVVYLSGRRDGS